MNDSPFIEQNKEDFSDKVKYSTTNGCVSTIVIGFVLGMFAAVATVLFGHSVYMALFVWAATFCIIFSLRIVEIFLSILYIFIAAFGVFLALFYSQKR